MGRCIQLYGWDRSRGGWSGPNELSFHAAGSQRLADALAATPGRSWYGPVTCSAARQPVHRFFAVIHDLADCAAATVYCDDSKTGPAEIVAIVPAGRRSRLRPEFAFEFLAFAGFLGSLPPGVESEVHEGIEAALAETDGSDSLVFSISTGMWSGDVDPAISQCVEKIATAVLDWLG